MDQPAQTYPSLLHTVIDCLDVRRTAEFYRELLGLHYRAGDEPPRAGAPDEADWLVLAQSDGTRVLAFQQVREQAPSTWPSQAVPQQLHLDFTVPDAAELNRHRDRAELLGGRLISDQSDDPDEALFVFADPEGHPFCIFVARPRMDDRSLPRDGQRSVS